MSDQQNIDDTLRLMMLNATPKWFKMTVGCLVTFVLCLNLLGLNVAGPIQVMAVAYAEAYKRDLNSSEEELELLRSIESRLIDLESISHEPTTVD